MANVAMELWSEKGSICIDARTKCRFRMHTLSIASQVKCLRRVQLGLRLLFLVPVFVPVHRIPAAKFVLTSVSSVIYFVGPDNALLAVLRH